MKTTVAAGLVVVSAMLQPLHVAAGKPDDVLPPAAAGILDQLGKEVEIAKTKAIVGLEKVLKETTKKGDLAGAIAVKNAIDKLKAEARGGALGRSVANRVAGVPVVGRWFEGGTSVDLQADGSVTATSGLTGQWDFDGRIVAVRWSNGHVYKFTIDPDGLAGVHINETGQEVSKIRWSRPK